MSLDHSLEPKNSDMASSSLFGQVDKFDAHGKESFTNYLERLEFYFIANDIDNDS